MATRPRNPANQAHQRQAAPRPHKIDELDRPLGGFEDGRKDQRAVEVATLDPSDGPDRSDHPSAVLGSAKQRGKACPGVEARQA
jgi:hypothetical protein